MLAAAVLGVHGAFSSSLRLVVPVMLVMVLQFLLLHSIGVCRGCQRCLLLHGVIQEIHIAHAKLLLVVSLHVNVLIHVIKHLTPTLSDGLHVHLVLLFNRQRR